jgi:hypothetical protein
MRKRSELVGRLAAGSGSLRISDVVPVTVSWGNSRARAMPVAHAPVGILHPGSSGTVNESVHDSVTPLAMRPMPFMPPSLRALP